MSFKLRRISFCSWIVSIGFLVVVLPRFTSADEPNPALPRFERDVLPILTAHCFKCHGLENKESNLDLRTVALMQIGGSNGRVIEKGSAANSALFKRIESRSMPPKKELPLTDEKIEIIRRWLDAGAISDNPDAEPPVPQSPVSELDRQFWAFQKPIVHSVPMVQAVTRRRNEIDAFVLEKLEQKSLTFARDADRATLVRRAFLDLIGFPPSPVEAAEFLNDNSPNSYERLLERLLASRHFGERWARHWLDAVGYTDTIGDDTDAAITKLGPGKWKYRDYVVKAFNEDKPYDRFLTEQIAGDELFDWRTAESFTPSQIELLVATGFLRTAADETLQNELNTADIRHSVLQHTMETSISGLIGMTLACARCHTHKYEPIPHEDYYRLLAVFTPAYNPQSWLQPAKRELPDVAPAVKIKFDQENAELDRQTSERKAKRDSIRKPYHDKIQAARYATLPVEIRDDCKKALETTADKRNEVQTYLVKKFESMLKVSNEQVTAALGPDDKAADDKLAAEIAELAARRRTWGTIQAVYDSGPAPPTYVLKRGNHETPGTEVRPGFLRVFAANDDTVAFSAEQPYAGASGRRLALAQCLTNRETAVGGQVARVFVNRVWQQLFGEGIVTTPENFGRSGATPTHPELLDWLAVQFMNGEWRIKPMIKRMMLSTAYRQSSKASDCEMGGQTQESIDPANSLIWRARLRPLEAETIRDSLLAISGQLDVSMGGEPVMHAPRPDGSVGIVEDAARGSSSKYRRSVYLLSRRRYHLSMLEMFDRPEVVSNCLKRQHAPVVTQSLMLLNDEFVHEQAVAFARRLWKDARNASPSARIDLAFQFALGRTSRPEEMTLALQLLQRHSERYRDEKQPIEQLELLAMTHVCQMLLNTSEFLYVN